MTEKAGFGGAPAVQPCDVGRALVLSVMQFSICRRALSLLAVIILTGWAPWVEGAAPALQLSAEGRALMPIVLGREADGRTEALARDLAAGLERITGATFAIRREESRAGIVVGTDRDWKGVLPPVAAGRSSLLAREDYTLRTDAQSLFVIGREAIGLQDAVWDLLFRIGFRQFFPGATWEIWPREPSLSLALDASESPDFLERRFAFSGVANATSLRKLGVHRDAESLRSYESYLGDIETWRVRNRLVSGFDLQSSHSYGAIVRRNPEHFATYPADLVPRESGETRKLDPSRSTVLEIAALDALRQLETGAATDSVSVEPSDGGGWRSDSPLGSPSDQALTLANHVARAIEAKYPGRKVGMLAYNEHSPPPHIDVEPNVVIGVTTLFIRGGYTVDQVIDGWRAHRADIGIREYLASFRAGRDYPGQTRADDLGYLATTIPHFHSKGAQYWKCEASRSWFPHGLGFYLTSRLLWKVSDANRVAEITSDFYVRAFGAAAGEMREFHEHYVLSAGRPLLSEDLVGRMYRLLQAALAKADSDEVAARLAEYVAWVRYLELSLATGNGAKTERTGTVRELDQWIYRFRNSPVVNAGGYYRELARSGAERKPEPNWIAGPLARDEAGEIARRGIAANRVNAFETVGFSTDLVPWTGAASRRLGGEFVSLGRSGVLYLHAEKPGSFAFEVEGNQLWTNRGPVKLRLFADANPLVDEPVAEIEAPADKTPHVVSLASPFAGGHRLEMTDGGAGTKISWPTGQRVVVPITPEQRAKVISNYKYDGVFYVPKGTKVVGGYCANPTGRILFPDGGEALNLKAQDRNSYFSIPVPEGRDGAIWQAKGPMRGFLLLTVPPYLARSPAELLVPAEVLR